MLLLRVGFQRTFSGCSQLIEMGKASRGSLHFKSWLKQMEDLKLEDCEPSELVEIFRCCSGEKINADLVSKIDDYFHYSPYKMSATECYNMVSALHKVEGMANCFHPFYVLSKRVCENPDEFSGKDIEDIIDIMDNHNIFMDKGMAFNFSSIRAKHRFDLRFLFTRKEKI